jgi:hypothetical protein
MAPPERRSGPSPDKTARVVKATGTALDVPTVANDLGIARGLAAAGVPVFVAYPDPDGKAKSGRATGYILRDGWETYAANPAYVDAWKPGLALCAVMGQGIDLVDIDPRNGGDPAALNGIMPRILGAAASPSGGYHLFVASMGVGSRDSVLPGIDVKAGGPDGRGRGFAFIAPTVRKSKTTGELAAYRWLTPPDLSRLDGDTSGAQLAELVRQARGSRKPGALPFQQPGGRREHAAPIPYGEHHDALVSYAGWMRVNRFPIREAEACMLMRLGDLVQPPGATQPKYTEAEALAELHDVYSRYAPGDPGAEDTAAGLPGRQLFVTLASQIKPRPVRWLWPDRIPSGALTLLAGREGIGKSLVGVHLAAQLTRGTLAGGRHGRPSRVMFATSEDAWEFTMVPRLLAAGANLTRVARVQVRDGASVTGLTTPADVPELRAYIASHDVALLILDPLTSVMDGRIDAHRDREVRTALEPLGQLAEDTGAAVLGHVHLGKGLGRDPVNLILGSRAFSAVARVALVAARDPDDETSNVLSVEKSNLGRIDVPGLTYRIDGAEIATDEGQASAGLLVWTGETDRRVRDIMADHDGERTERDEAAEWLTGYLADHDGQAPFAEVAKDGRVNGHAERTLRRAARLAGIEITSAGFPRRTVWTLPGPVRPQSGQSGQDTRAGRNGAPVAALDGDLCAMCGNPLDQALIDAGFTTHGEEYSQ